MRAFLVYNNYLTPDGGGLQIGGVQSYIENLSALLIEIGYSVTVIQCGKQQFDVFWNGATVSCVRIGLITNFSILLQRNKLIKKLKSYFPLDADLIVFMSDHFARPTGFKNTIVIQHGIDWDLPKSHFGNLISKSNFFTFVMKKCKARSAIKGVLSARKRVCVDYNFLNWLRCNVIEEISETRVIPNFVHIKNDRFLIRKNSKDAPLEILFARRFVSYRGTQIVLEAIKDYFDLGYKANFTFAGSGPDEELLRREFENNNNIKFARYSHTDSVKFHSNYDIALIPSLGSEGTSLSAIEAMSAGCAVIASNVGGLPNIIIDGYNGLLVDPKSECVLGAIIMLTNNMQLLHKLSENAKHVARDSFGYERWKKEWTEFIRY